MHELLASLAEVNLLNFGHFVSKGLSFVAAFASAGLSPAYLVSESGRPGRAEPLAKKRPLSRRRRLSAELQNVRETSGKLGEISGKLRGNFGEAPTLSNFLEKCCILEKFRKILVKFGENSGKFCDILEKKF